jgi:hypothetical protein
MVAVDLLVKENVVAMEAGMITTVATAAGVTSVITMTVIVMVVVMEAVGTMVGVICGVADLGQATVVSAEVVQSGESTAHGILVHMEVVMEAVVGMVEVAMVAVGMEVVMVMTGMVVVLVVMVLVVTTVVMAAVVVVMVAVTDTEGEVADMAVASDCDRHAQVYCPHPQVAVCP